MRLGAHAFETIGGEVVNVAFVTLTHRVPVEGHMLIGLDLSDEPQAAGKSAALAVKSVVQVSQAAQLANADWAILLEPVDSKRVLGRFAECYQGISSTDAERFIFPFWELNRLSPRWVPNQNPPDRTGYARGREFVIDWETLRRGVQGAALRGNAAYTKLGIAIGQVKSLPATLYSGEKFADSSPVIIPHDPKNLPAVWCFASSPVFNTELRKTNAKLSVNNGYVGKVPFDLTHWQKVAAERYPSGLPKLFSDDPTQWLFDGNPKGSAEPLHVAVARLLGYQWPRQTGSSFPDCPPLGPDGVQELADRDGIVCLSATKGEAPAAERLRTILAQAFAKFDLGGLIASAGPKGSKSETLEEWLRDEFFEQHSRSFTIVPSSGTFGTVTRVDSVRL
jgi:hypothetical protein